LIAPVALIEPFTLSARLPSSLLQLKKRIDPRKNIDPIVKIFACFIRFGFEFLKEYFKEPYATSRPKRIARSKFFLSVCTPVIKKN
jgi:hypothetical protein